MNILIFGATSGIGRTLAEQYAANGNKVAVTGRRQEKLDELKAAYPDTILTIRHNIRELNKIADVIEQTHQQFKKIDLIIVNAGIGKYNLKLEWEICESVLKTNVLGVSRALIESYNYFKLQGKGH